jgi:hypothetical protein
MENAKRLNSLSPDELSLRREIAAMLTKQVQRAEHVRPDVVAHSALVLLEWKIGAASEEELANWLLHARLAARGGAEWKAT